MQIGSLTMLAEHILRHATSAEAGSAVAEASELTDAHSSSLYQRHVFRNAPVLYASASNLGRPPMATECHRWPPDATEAPPLWPQIRLRLQPGCRRLWGDAARGHRRPPTHVDATRRRDAPRACRPRHRPDGAPVAAPLDAPVVSPVVLAQLARAAGLLDEQACPPILKPPLPLPPSQPSSASPPFLPPSRVPLLTVPRPPFPWPPPSHSPSASPPAP